MRLIKNTRAQLLLLAFSILALSFVFSLSAYLANEQPFSANYRTPSDSELGFSFTGLQPKDQLLTPGQSLDAPVGVKVSGPNSLYVFIVYDPPEALTVSNFNSTSWLKVEGYSNVYYYGTSSGLVALDKDNNPEARILDGVTLPREAEVNGAFSLNITGYAIQSDYLPADATIKDIYDMAKTYAQKNGGTNP